MRQVGAVRYDHINLFGKSKHVSTLVLPCISYIASGLALLKNEQKFNLGVVLALIKHRFYAPTYRLNV
jgi:hypothetical protein